MLQPPSVAGTIRTVLDIKEVEGNDAVGDERRMRPGHRPRAVILMQPLSALPGDRVKQRGYVEQQAGRAKVGADQLQQCRVSNELVEGPRFAC